MKIKIYSKHLKLLFGIAIIGLAIYYAQANFDKFSAIKNIDAVSAILLLAYGFISYFFLALTFNYTMKLFGVKLKASEWLGLTLTNTMYNYILPARSGFVARAYYLKENYAFDYSKYISFLGGSFVVSFLVASLTSMCLIGINNYFYNQFYDVLFYISLAVFLGTATFSLVFWNHREPKIKTGWRKLDTFIVNTVSGLQYFKSSKNILTKVFLINFALIFIRSFRLYFAFLAINVDVGFLNVYIMHSILVYSIVISLTPGNIGIKEGIIVLMAGVMGISLSDAILAAAIDRAVSMVIVFSTGSVYHFFLINKSKKNKSTTLK